MGRGTRVAASPNGPAPWQQANRTLEEDADDDDEEEGGPRSYSAIMNISDRLTGLQDNLEYERQQRFNELSEKMSLVGERISVAEDAAVLKCKGLRDDLGTFQKQVLKMREERSFLAERKTEEIRSLEEKLEVVQEAEIAAGRRSEDRIKDLFAGKTAALAKEVKKETTLRKGYEATLRQYLEHDVVKLKEALLQESADREAMEMKIVKAASQTIFILESELKDEIKAREDTEEAMLRMMEDLVTKMEGDIAAERRDRAKKEEMLSNLLQFTCTKLQASSQSL